jgi:hypothetical protein
MYAPVNPMYEHNADVAMASTLDYIAYCVKRLYPQGGVIWCYEERPANGELRCRLLNQRNGHGFVARFQIPIDAGGVQIKSIVSEAADVLDNMILRIKTK